VKESYILKDFNDLLELNLKEQVLVGDLIDKLRHSTHGVLKCLFY
jgi:hypothetical protein